MPGYFSFDTLISSSLIKATYVLGMLCITLGSIAFIGITAYNQVNAPPALQDALLTATVVRVIAGGAALLLGNLLWRVVCETWILLFSMHGQLVAIKDELRARPH